MKQRTYFHYTKAIHLAEIAEQGLRPRPGVDDARRAARSLGYAQPRLGADSQYGADLHG